MSETSKYFMPAANVYGYPDEDSTRQMIIKSRHLKSEEKILKQYPLTADERKDDSCSSDLTKGSPENQSVQN